MPSSKKITIDDSIKKQSDITNQIQPKNTLTGSYDFISELWQVAFNYDTWSYSITESQPSERSMILLTLSSISWQEIGRIGVFHNWWTDTSSRDWFWADEARSIAITQNLSGICLDIPPGLRDSCTEKENSNNIFYATVNGVYRTWPQQIEYPKKQRYLQNTLSEFPGILFTTEEVWLQYTGLLQDIVDSIVFFETDRGSTKTYYGEGINIDYPSEANHIRRSWWFDEISLLTWDNAIWSFRVNYTNYNCSNFFTNQTTHSNFIESNSPYHIIKASATGSMEWMAFVWCIDTKDNTSITITSDTPIENLVSNLKLTQ